MVKMKCQLLGVPIILSEARCPSYLFLSLVKQKENSNDARINNHTSNNNGI